MLNILNVIKVVTALFISIKFHDFNFQHFIVKLTPVKPCPFMLLRLIMKPKTYIKMILI